MNTIHASTSPMLPSAPRAKGVQPHDRSHSLNIFDDFQLSPLAQPVKVIPSFPPGGKPIPIFDPPHGVMVEGAARSTGFQGEIQRIQTDENPLLQNQRIAEMELRFHPMGPAAARQTLDRFVKNQSMALMLGAGNEMQSQILGSTHQAVTSFSLGAGAASATAILYRQARLAWTPPGPSEAPANFPDRRWAEQVLRNLAIALEMSPQDLVRSDPAVSGPARSQFQQRLVDSVSRSARSAQVRTFHQKYAGVVEQYEALGNSVVLGAGNEGDLLQQMQRDNGGQAIHAPPGFYDSTLHTDQTTRVGALTARDDLSLTVADYSSAGDQVQILAWARAYTGHPGTSFAAPRVAAMMQRIHELNPTMSSAEVEATLFKLPETVPVGGTYALIL